MNNLQLIETNIEDLKILTEMYIQLRSDEKIDNIMTYNEVFNQMEGFIKSDSFKIYKLIYDNKTCGYALYDISKNPLYLRHLYIDMNYRNKGFGKYIVTESLAIFKCNEIDIDVMIWNDNALE